jgi:hypothetical protein
MRMDCRFLSREREREKAVGFELKFCECNEELPDIDMAVKP